MSVIVVVSRMQGHTNLLQSCSLKSLCVLVQAYVSLPSASLHLCFLPLCVLVQACLRVQVYTVIYHADV